MKQLHFTTGVLGPLAAYRLEQHQITQTLMSVGSDIIKAILAGELKIGDQIQVTLDDRAIGLAQLVSMDTRTWVDIDSNDAQRGGFDSGDELEKALQRAGYRFQAIDMYQLYRIQFSWLLEYA